MVRSSECLGPSASAACTFYGSMWPDWPVLKGLLMNLRSQASIFFGQQRRKGLGMNTRLLFTEKTLYTSRTQAQQAGKATQLTRHTVSSWVHPAYSLLNLQQAGGKREFHVNCLGEALWMQLKVLRAPEVEMLVTFQVEVIPPLPFTRTIPGEGEDTKGEKLCGHLVY